MFALCPRQRVKWYWYIGYMVHWYIGFSSNYKGYGLVLVAYKLRLLPIGLFCESPRANTLSILHCLLDTPHDNSPTVGYSDQCYTSSVSKAGDNNHGSAHTGVAEANTANIHLAAACPSKNVFHPIDYRSQYRWHCQCAGLIERRSIIKFSPAHGGPHRMACACIPPDISCSSDVYHKSVTVKGYSNKD